MVIGDVEVLDVLMHLALQISAGRVAVAQVPGHGMH